MNNIKEPELTKNIATKEDFVNFVKKLSEECAQNPEFWEHKDLSVFLDALAEFAESIDGFYANFGIPFPKDPDWKMMANMLAAARNY